MQTITLSYWSEWKREIPVGNLIEIINFTAEFTSPNGIIAPNMSINNVDTLFEVLDKL